jgi:ABC transporter substrate binding protein (PQQ-dependent alcohol dehydrogenase system)
MIVRAFAVALTLASSAAAQDSSFSILYLARDGDPTYEDRREYAGLGLPPPVPPIEGALVAIAEAKILGRALKLRIGLEERRLAEGENPVAAVAAAAPRAVLLDLPLAEVEAVAAALGDRHDLILFNIRHPDDALRADRCAGNLLHTFPSRSMIADAMAQFLAARDWRQVLLLAGPDPASLADAGAFEAAAEKFGVEIVETRPFELTNDPRRRELNNIALLTGGVGYDVVYVADAVGEFARFVPYATYAPRPVVGAAGLKALAWHWTLERSGAPQLNQRFARRSEARMSPQDWAAWAAVRTVVEAITKTGGTDMPELRAFIESDGFALDLYKGLPGSYRPWDGQLRQPVILADSAATIATAPLPEFLHESNVLDTLGADRPEAPCPKRAGR